MSGKIRTAHSAAGAAAEPGVTVLSVNDGKVLAAIHADCFDAPWDAAAFSQLLSMPGTFGLIGKDGAQAVGMILARIAGEDCEVLTVAVLLEARRRGIGGVLLDQAAQRGARLGAQRQVLEVGVGNGPALRLYARIGFMRCGERPGYYSGTGGDACILARPIAGPGLDE